MLICYFLRCYTPVVVSDQVRLTCFLGANKGGALPLLINTHHAHQVLCVRQQVCGQ